VIARYTIGVVTCNDCPVDHRRRQWHPRKVHETGRLTMEVAANSQSVARDADAAGEKVPDAYWRLFRWWFALRVPAFLRCSSSSI